MHSCTGTKTQRMLATAQSLLCFEPMKTLPSLLPADGVLLLAGG
jgi:hypothetical protein